MSEVAAKIEISAERLGTFLGAQFGSAPVKIERIGGGQSNPTYFVDHGNRRMVLRKKPEGKILPGAHAIERECRILRALQNTRVPVPEVVLLCEDSAVLGTPFYLMNRIEGRVFHDCALAAADPDERRAIYFAMAETLAVLHGIRPSEIGLADFGRHGGYFQRQLARWSRQYFESPGERIPDIDRLIGWLNESMPADDGALSIAHGDFRLGNLMFHPTEPKVVAVLDWELSTLGHPLADLGFGCIPWHSAPDEYGGILGLDLQSLRVPTQREFVDRYYSVAGEGPKLAPFHIAFALFRFAVIFVGIADRARDGNATSGDAARVGALAQQFARRAVSAADIN